MPARASHHSTISHNGFCTAKVPTTGFVLRCLAVMCFVSWVISGTSIEPARADHGPRTWSASHKSVLVVAPTWPGYARPGFGAPSGVAPEGSGIVYPIGSSDGSYILTAAHVVAEAEKIEIILADGTRHEAELHALDMRRDIAVLHAKPRLSTITLADSIPAVGEHVCALVNAFGLGVSFTCGVTSATARQNIGFNEIEDFIQTDAAINPGASGGALVRADGALVGMVSAIFTKEADIDAGVNFAVSLSLIEQSLLEMRNNGVTF